MKTRDIHRIQQRRDLIKSHYIQEEVHDLRLVKSPRSRASARNAAPLTSAAGGNGQRERLKGVRKTYALPAVARMIIIQRANSSWAAVFLQRIRARSSSWPA